ncbi:diguanylate cyclase/phosphodiesterase (GGDEF & EAL domains) with PAS/PAC sensor(s) [hydrothermal vent metagenome]|uniref:Diguanylate cyclase/phosphodiesterase (GGDEF & EAL domains) with PAS/PAC sensor(S) n=1 Tax=hydrothermal vent metagenome TaxID=652676 RepID=A0A1W1C274_9ZZZZ
MSLNSFTLLYVEDDVEIQSAMKDLLENEVQALYQAYDAQEGLALFQEKKPDIVLADISMPQMDGLEMATRIKQIDKNQPIVMITAYDEKDMLLRAIDIGIDGYVVKPVDLEKLLGKLESISQNLCHKKDVEKAKEERLREKEKKLYELAHFDPLTSISNRFLFQQELEQIVKETEQKQSQTALLFIDLDNFKAINDTYGHRAGDSVLVHFAAKVKKLVDKNDIFSRIGGDEFAIIVKNVSSGKSLEILAQNIVESTREATLFEGKELFVSCSIGIADYSYVDGDMETWVHQADTAMYQAKSKGKSNFVFYEK